MSIIIKIINFIESKIEFQNFALMAQQFSMVWITSTELWMTKYIIGEFF